MRKIKINWGIIIGLVIALASFIIAWLTENALFLPGAFIGLGIIVWFFPFPKKLGF